jgi:hypothetical protein
VDAQAWIAVATTAESVVKVGIAEIEEKVEVVAVIIAAAETEEAAVEIAEVAVVVVEDAKNELLKK